MPRFTYADESNRVGYPLGADTQIEGGRDSGGDMHAVVVDQDTCRLYETWNTRESSGTMDGGVGCRVVAEVEQAAARHLDLRGRGRAADPARPAALERGEDGHR